MSPSYKKKVKVDEEKSPALRGSNVLGSWLIFNCKGLFVGGACDLKQPESISKKEMLRYLNISAFKQKLEANVNDFLIHEKESFKIWGLITGVKTYCYL
jgi:hypothetical protein